MRLLTEIYHAIRGEVGPGYPVLIDLSLVLAAFLGFGLNVVMMLAGYLAAYRKSREEQTFNIVNYSGYNIGTFAMPYLHSFLGNAGTIVACIFDAGNALMCTGLTYAFAAGFCGKQVERGLGAFAVRLFASVPFDVYGIDLVKRLRRKLKEAGCSASVKTVWGFGFRLEGGKEGET